MDGAHAPRDLARIGVGITLAAQAMNLFLRYDGSFADSYRSQAATGGLRVSFERSRPGQVQAYWSELIVRC